MKKGIILCLLGLIIVIAGCASIPIGDGGTLKIQKDGITIGSSNEDSGNMDISVKDGEMVISGTDSQGEEFEQKISTEQKLPDEFPKDIPIPSNVELTVIESEIGESTQYIVKYSVTGTVLEYYNQYRTYVEQAGFSTIIDASEGNADEDTSLENIMAKSDDETLSVGIMKSGTGDHDDGTISVNLMYMMD